MYPCKYTSYSTFRIVHSELIQRVSECSALSADVLYSSLTATMTGSCANTNHQAVTILAGQCQFFYGVED